VFFGANPDVKFDGLIGIALLVIGYCVRLLVERWQKRSVAPGSIRVPMPAPPQPPLPQAYSSFPSTHDLMIHRQYVQWGRHVINCAQAVDAIVGAVREFSSSCHNSGRVPSSAVLTKCDGALSNVRVYSNVVESGAQQVHADGLKLPAAICDLDAAVRAAAVVLRVADTFLKMEFPHEQEDEMLAQLREHHLFWQALAQPWIQQPDPTPDWDSLGSNDLP